MAARGATAALPLAAICCLALILFGIAATVVLALIPIYIPAKNINTASANSFQKTRSYSVPVSSKTATGPLNANQQAALSNKLSTSQTGSTANRGAITVQSANVGSVNGRKRQSNRTKFCFFVVIIGGQTQRFLRLIEALLDAFIIANAADLGLLIESLVGDETTTSTTTTTTVNPAVISTTVNSAVISTVAPGRRRRQQTNEQAFPSAPLVIYED